MGNVFCVRARAYIMLRKLSMTELIEFLDRRRQWLENVGSHEWDVMVDEGGEYVKIDPDLMDDGDEPEDGRMKKVYLPKEIQQI